MKKGEINIGDWVQSKSDQSIIQIKTHWDIYNAKDFEPIPITQEILDKIGFKDIWMTDGTVWEFDEYYIIYNINTDCLLVIRGDDWLLDTSVITYVHELQHALRLCKIDKEIII